MYSGGNELFLGKQCSTIEYRTAARQVRLSSCMFGSRMTVPHSRLLIRLLHSSCPWLSTFLVYMLEPAFFTASHVNRTLSYDHFQVVRGAAATVTNVVASGDLACSQPYFGSCSSSYSFPSCLMRCCYLDKCHG